MFLLFFSLFFIILFFSFLGGLIFSLLWGWFIVPLGIPAITVIHAMGLNLLIGFFANSYKNMAKLDFKDSKNKATIALFTLFLNMLIPVIIGFIIHKFM